MENNKKLKKHIKTLREFLNEQQNNVDETYIKTINFNGEKLTLHKIADDPMKVQFYLNTIEGEPYIDINKIIPTNLLIDAIWVKTGGVEEKVADMLGDILQKTNRTTSSGYNNYVMYNIFE